MGSTVAHQITLVQLVVGLGAAWIITILVSKSISLRSALKSLGNCPGKGIVLLHPVGSAGYFAAPIFPFKGMVGDYYGKFSQYRKYGRTCLSSITLEGSRPVIWTADPDVFRVVSMERSTFIKDTETYAAINIYGHNIIGTEGAEWKRHRDVARSAFNDAKVNVAWEESIRVVNEWFDAADLAGRTDGEEINLPPVFANITLLVLSSAGFGRRTSWISASSGLESDSPHSMGFMEAMRSTVQYFFLKLLTPTCVYTLSQKVYIPWLTPALNNTTIAFESLRSHMLEIISDARAVETTGAKARTNHPTSWGTANPKEIKFGLLANLVEANQAYHEDNAANRTLTDEELLSDTFVFLLAGHESSLNTLCFATLLLALHPDKQEKVLLEVINLWPNGAPTLDSFTTYKESMPKLAYTTAVIHETLRMFPVAVRLGRRVAANTCVKAKIFDNDSLEVLKEVDVPVPAGSDIVLDILGLHMNPLAWGDDVEIFVPERFIDTEGYRWPREAFAGFSLGPRNCIGQRFALAETVCVLALLIRRCEVLVPVSLEGRNMEEKKRHMLAWIPGLATIPTNAQVRVKERSK